MTKYAVRAFSDGLRREMVRFGIKVITIEPNLYRTASFSDQNLLHNSIDQIWSQTDEEVKFDYGGDDSRDKFESHMLSFIQVARPQIEEVIDVQEEAVTIQDPDVYYRCAGTLAKIGLWMLECVSDLGQDYLLTGSVWKRFVKLFSMK
jgi:NAD(P)-dependent dehydrogenase (short-subunit alcohol dehydrogenase family)